MHTLPKLDYSYDALEPFIDAKTMELHHTKHHQTYIDKLNTALENNKALKDLEIGQLLSNIMNVPEEIRTTVINNGGGHANHSLFWKIMTPKDKSKELNSGSFFEALETEFGNMETFKEKFSDLSLNLFGSGWVFLTISPNWKLKLKQMPLQNSPLMDGDIPLLGLDVWEHAYYLKYQNKRADYIKAWWNVVNWNEVESRFESYIKR